MPLGGSGLAEATKFGSVIQPVHVVSLTEVRLVLTQPPSRQKTLTGTQSPDITVG